MKSHRFQSTRLSKAKELAAQPPSNASMHKDGTSNLTSAGPVLIPEGGVGWTCDLLLFLRCFARQGVAPSRSSAACGGRNGNQKPDRYGTARTIAVVPLQ